MKYGLRCTTGTGSDTMDTAVASWSKYSKEQQKYWRIPVGHPGLCYTQVTYIPLSVVLAVREDSAL